MAERKETDSASNQAKKRSSEFREKVANIIKDLGASYRNTESEDTLLLINEFSDVLRSSIYDEKGNLRPLRQ